MEAAFLFGRAGNLTGFLGSGWSVEEHYVWAVGEQSTLELPLFSNEAAYEVRFVLHPFVHPGVRESQRLVIMANGEELGRFDLTEWTTLSIPLPEELTRGRNRIALTLLHPEGLRPSDVKDTSDSRLLSLCFHAARLAHRKSATGGTWQSDVCHGIVAGNATARQIAGIVSRLPSLNGRLELHYVDLDMPLDQTEADRPPQALASAQFCWLQSDIGKPAVRTALRDALPATCDVRTFPALRCDALWPLQGVDSRAVPEPNPWWPARYPVTDRVAASLAYLNMPDDVVYLMYESMSEAAMTNLDAVLAADLAAWKLLDSRNDIRIADFLQRNFRHKRLFIAPTVPARAVVRELIDRLVALPAIHALIDASELTGDLDQLMEGYGGQREEVPIHPGVGRHFQLAWWSPEMRYRWHNNRYGFRDYIIDYIRWAPWRR